MGISKKRKAMSLCSASFWYDRNSGTKQAWRGDIFTLVSCAALLEMNEKIVTVAV